LVFHVLIRNFVPNQSLEHGSVEHMWEPCVDRHIVVCLCVYVGM